MRGRRIVFAAALASSLLSPLRAVALDAHALSALLPPDSRRNASPAMLADLDALAAHYAGAPASSLPSVKDLRAAALSLQAPRASTSNTSPWRQFKAWLRRRLAPAEGLLRWFRALPGSTVGPGLRGVLLIGAGVLVLSAIAAFILLELRAAGRTGARGRRNPWALRRSGRPQAPTGAEHIGRDPDPGHALGHPAAALRMLMEALRRSRRIEKDHSLTCREIMLRAVFDTEAQRDRFARIALLAERELYGPDDPGIAMPDDLRAGLQGLHGQLLTIPAASRSDAS